MRRPPTRPGAQKRPRRWDRPALPGPASPPRSQATAHPTAVAEQSAPPHRGPTRPMRALSATLNKCAMAAARAVSARETPKAWAAAQAPKVTVRPELPLPPEVMAGAIAPAMRASTPAATHALTRVVRFMPDASARAVSALPKPMPCPSASERSAKTRFMATPSRMKAKSASFNSDQQAHTAAGSHKRRRISSSPISGDSA